MPPVALGRNPSCQTASCVSGRNILAPRPRGEPAKHLVRPAHAAARLYEDERYPAMTGSIPGKGQ